MNTTSCPNCNANLPPQEIAEGWCETCGKKIPPWVRGEQPAHKQTEFRQPLRERGVYSSLIYRPLASRLARLGAATVDVLLTWLALSPAFATDLISGTEVNRSLDSPGMVLGILGVGILAIVQMVLLSMSGQTIGKKVMRIRIVRAANEANPGFVGAVLLRAVVPALIGGLPCVGPLFGLFDILFIFAEDRRCIHDLIAGTKVVVA